MSLNQLRAEANEADQEDVVVEPVDSEDEPGLGEATAEPEEGSSSDDTEEAPAEPSDDFELTLDGESEPDQQKPDPKEALIHKLTKQRKRAQNAETTAEAEKARADKLEAEIEALKAQISGKPQAAQPVIAPQKFPDLYDKGIDGDPAKHSRAVARWHDERAAQEAQRKQAEAQQRQWQEKLDSDRLNLAERAAAFASEHNISIDRTADAITRACEEVDRITGVEGALADLISAVGDGGERAAYLIGTNQAKMDEFVKAWNDDPRGFKANSLLTRYAMQAKPKQSKQISSAPEPDEALRGDGSSKSQKKLQEALDKASEKGDIKEMKKITAKARELGVKLT